MRGSRKKNAKTSRILGQKGQFLTFFGQNGENLKKALGTFFSHLQALKKCKVSEKRNEQFPRKSVAYVRTDGQTRLLRSQQPVGLESKNLHFWTF